MRLAKQMYRPVHHHILKRQLFPPATAIIPTWAVKVPRALVTMELLYSEVTLIVFPPAN